MSRFSRFFYSTLLTSQLLLTTLESPGLAQTTGNVNPDGPAEFIIQGDQVHMTGSIFPSTVRRFRQAVSGRAGLRTLVLNNVPGSTDDDAALELYREVRRRGFNTHVPAHGVVVSGGVDLFCAGVKRTAEPGSLLLVHPWEDNQLGRGDRVPLNHRIHDFYRNYYAEMGIAQGFYEHTLFAPRSTHFRGNETYLDLHNLSEESRRQFRVTTASTSASDPVPPSNTPVTLSQLIGSWVVTTNGQTARITITQSSGFTYTDSVESTRGTVVVGPRQVTLNAIDGRDWSLTLQQVSANVVRFDGVDWVRSAADGPAPQPPAELTLDGTWTEVRTDHRPQKIITVTGNRYLEFTEGVLFTGTITLDGDQMTIRGEDDSVERFQVRPAPGGRINFRNSQTGRLISRFHWVKM